MVKRIKRWAGILCWMGVFLGACGGWVRAAQPTVSAESAVVLLADTGAVLYEKEAHTSRPMASTTKIMTALLALEAGQELGNPVVEITEEMVAVEGSSMGLLPGDRVTLEGLAAGMLLASGNDAANGAALYLDGSLEQFAERMNARAADLGMEDTWFVTPSGLDGVSPEGREHVSTAYDMALLAQEALKNPSFQRLCSSVRATVHMEDPERSLTLTNHNRLLTQYQGCVGVKTGFTKKAGRCLVSAAQRDGALLVAVTLHAPDDWNDHVLLLDYGFSQVRTVSLDGEIPSLSLPVVGSEAESVSVSCSGEGTSVALGPQDVLERRVYGPAFLYAPIHLGDCVGQVRWYVGDRCVAQKDLTAQEEAPLSSEKDV